MPSLLQFLLPSLLQFLLPSLLQFLLPSFLQFLLPSLLQRKCPLEIVHASGRIWRPWRIEKGGHEVHEYNDTKIP